MQFSNKKTKDTMRKVSYLMAVAIVAVAFMACTDEDSILAEVVIPEETNLMQLERYSYELPFEVKSDSEWEIKFHFDDGEICYALPDQGTGSQTVQLCITDNPLEKRRVGEMHIIFPKDASKNQVIKLQQKSIAEDGENAGEVERGNRSYVVGYGYNTLNQRASIKSVSRAPILKTAYIRDTLKQLVIGPVDASYNVRTYTGSSVSELSNQLSANAKFGGKYLGFKGEIGAAFDMKDFSKQENEYAISYVEVEKQSAIIEMNLAELRKRKNMTEAAYRAINGLSYEEDGDVYEADYPSTPEGLAQLVQDYGTHLVVSARLGGCLKYVTTVDISNVEGSYDLKAFANCSYENSFVNLNANVSDSLHKSFNSNSKAIHTTLRVQGGSSSAADKLAQGGTGKDNAPNYNAWLESLNDVSNQTLVGLDVEGLIPLYELVNKNLQGGKERYAALKGYINGDQIESDMSKALNMEYEMGDATHLPTIPDFSAESENHDQSLIKDYHRGGQAVARICHEYIPVIDKFQRVCVIYPILSNKVKYNMGYFVGDDTHRPAKVCWSSDGLSVKSLQDQPMGRATELWVRGSNFFKAPDDSTIVNAFETVDATVQPYTVNAPGIGAGVNIDYPLVKIFNQLWMREDYKATHTTTGTNLKNVTKDKTNNYYTVYYSPSHILENNFAPQGWRVTSFSDFRNIEATLNANDVRHISTGKAFSPDKDGGVLGFYNMKAGRCENLFDLKEAEVWEVVSYGSYSQYWCMKPDRSWEGSFIISDNFSANNWPGRSEWFYQLAVRLVQDIY